MSVFSVVNVALAVLLALVASPVLLALAARRREKEIWNGGVCKKSERPWQFKGFTRLGERLYEDGQGNAASIIYGVDMVKHTPDIPRTCVTCRYSRKPFDTCEDMELLCFAPQNINYQRLKAVKKLTGDYPEMLTYQSLKYHRCVVHRSDGWLSAFLLGTCGARGRWFVPKENC